MRIKTLKCDIVIMNVMLINNMKINFNATCVKEKKNVHKESFIKVHLYSGFILKVKIPFPFKGKNIYFFRI